MNSEELGGGAAQEWCLGFVLSVVCMISKHWLLTPKLTRFLWTKLLHFLEETQVVGVVLSIMPGLTRVVTIVVVSLNSIT